jgi:hypothetical protein
MKSRVLQRRHVLLLLPVVLMFATEPVFAQPTPADAEAFQARIDAAAVALGDNPRFKNLSLKYRQSLAEFVTGNMLFVVLHEMAHAAISEMGLPVLGREEDAADSYAATRLIRIGSGVSNRVLTEAAKGWFMADRRDQREGHPLPYYDEHGLNRVRAYQIVCLMVGSNRNEFKDLASETKLPEERQDSCAKDYNKSGEFLEFGAQRASARARSTGNEDRGGLWRGQRHPSGRRPGVSIDSDAGNRGLLFVATIRLAGPVHIGNANLRLHQRPLARVNPQADIVLRIGP